MHPGHRWAVLLALVGCEPPAPAPEPPPPRWVYAPPPPSWPLGELRGRFGRSQAPQLPLIAGITGAPTAPLRLATVFAVPGDGPARAIAYGLEGAQQAIELIEIDTGRVVWRDTAECEGPVVGVTEAAVVCADVQGVRGLGLDGKPRWRSKATYLAMTADRVVTAGPGEAIVLGADDGEELARVKLPAGISIESIVASCGDAGRELFASGRDGKLVRIAEVKGKPAITWAVPIGGIASSVGEIDACDGASILVTTGGSVTAIERATGKVTGRVDGVRGAWKARDGSERIELATVAGVAGWPRELTGTVRSTELPALGELIAARGELRLVRASPFTAVVLDRRGIRAHLVFGAMGGALGDTAIVGSSWNGSPGETVHRLGLPSRWRRASLRLPRPLAVAVPAELRDLPAPALLDPAAAIAKPDTAMFDVRAAALDRRDAATLYAVTLERVPDDSASAGLASVDLARRTWRWQRSDGCGPGTPVAVAVAADVVVCGARTTVPPAATVRATSRDGASRWAWDGDNVDAIEAAGTAVIIHDAGRLHVLDAVTGRLRGRIASDDGTPLRAAVVAVDDATYLVTFERGRLVARLPSSGLLPAWSLAVDGVVRSIAASAGGVLVELEDGDAYRIDLRTVAAMPIVGLGLAWRAAGDLVTGDTSGGVIPGLPVPPVRRPVLPPRDGYGRPIVPDPERPRLWTPIPPPPPLGDSWQYTLYELTGALRARNDYALEPPIAPAVARGPAGSPLVVASGPGLREVLVLDPRTGDPVKRVQLPENAARGLVFGTIVDGTPVAGAVLAGPLRVVLF
jgi:hypothetical protein